MTIVSTAGFVVGGKSGPGLGSWLIWTPDRNEARLVRKWFVAVEIGLQAHGTASLRHRTLALIYRRIGRLRAVRLLPGRTGLAGLVRYLPGDRDGRDAAVPRDCHGSSA